MHIIPCAGSASRFGGIPKFLLPVDPTGAPALFYHIDAALDSGEEEVVVICHPFLFDYLGDLLAHHQKPVELLSYKSITMTDTLIYGASHAEGISDVVTVSLPDTITTTAINSEFSGYLKSLRENQNALLLYEFIEEYRGRFGQVEYDPFKNRILCLKDKDNACNFPYIWGAVSVSREKLISFDSHEQTIGNCIQREIQLGTTFKAIISTGKYYDCGSMPDYLKYIESIN
jgi:hypothetical protein